DQRPLLHKQIMCGFKLHLSHAHAPTFAAICRDLVFVAVFLRSRFDLIYISPLACFVVSLLRHFSYFFLAISCCFECLWYSFITDESITAGFGLVLLE